MGCDGTRYGAFYVSEVLEMKFREYLGRWRFYVFDGLSSFECHICTGCAANEDYDAVDDHR